MASEWPEVFLEDVAEELTVGFVGPMATQYVPEGIPFLRSLNVEPLRVATADMKFITTEFHARLKKSALSPGDVVIVRTGKPGACVVIPDWLPVANCSDVVIVRCGSKLNAHFLAYYVNVIARDHVAAHLVGAVQQHFNVGAARRMKIPLPSMAEQGKIVESLRAIDQQIDVLEIQNKTLEAIARAIFKSWFVDFDPVRAKAEGREPEGMDAATAALFPDEFEEGKEGLIPKGWKQDTLGAITTRITKGTTPTTLKRRFVDSGINFIKAESISDAGYLLPEKFAFIDESTDDLLKRSKIEESDVLVTIAGTIGRIAVAPRELLPANTNQAVAIIRPNADSAPASFLRRFLFLPDTQQALNERTVQAVQANVSLATLSSLEVVLPPPEVMRKLCALVLEPIDEKIGCNIHSSTTLRDLRDTLLPRLISGKLRVSEAEKLVEPVL